MLKSKTHFEQVPLEEISEILKKETPDQAIQAEVPVKNKNHVLEPTRMPSPIAGGK